jgi:hypothetical protein
MNGGQVFVFIKFYFTQYRDIESSHNWAEMRILVEKTFTTEKKREHGEGVSCYGIRSKGIWKFFAKILFRGEA